MLTIQTHTTADGHPAALNDGPVHDPFVNLGDVTAVLARRRDGPVWETMRFGMGKFAEDGLLSHAREDHLDTTERWAMAINRRVAIPICGYRWSARSSAWAKIPTGWTMGIYDDGAFVVISPPMPESRPIVGSRADAEAWLTAKQWDGQKILRGLAAAMAA